jgi:branched-chain amino acid transport system substrate-binding protein
MSDDWKEQKWAQDVWYSGKITRRKLIGYGAASAGALGATMLVPAPWRAAFGQAKPYKIGTLQPLSGTAAAGGKTALVGVQMAVDRINKMGGINGRPVELLIQDYESKPDVGRRKAEKLVVEDKIDAHVGGYLSNVCLACMPVYEEAKTVNMISVCLDTTITTSKCSRYSFRAFDYAPAQAVAFAPYLVNKVGKKWHIAYLDYAWGQSTRDAYIEQIKKSGGEVVGTTGIPLGTADMTPSSPRSPESSTASSAFSSGQRGDLRQPGLRPRLDQEVQDGRRRCRGRVDALPALGVKIEGFVGVNRYVPVMDAPLNTRTTRSSSTMRWCAEADRPVRTAARPLRAVELRGHERPQDRHGEVELPGRDDTMKLIEALEGLEMKEGDDFPQGDKLLRKEDHQAFLREFIFDVKDGKHRILETIPGEKTIVPPACKFG